MLKDDTCNFETPADIIKTLQFTVEKDCNDLTETFISEWESIVGEKIAKYSKPKKLTESGILIVSCKNSTVGNEIFHTRTKINSILKEKAKENEINFFKYIKIIYE